jgi:pilus assembly protein Flp/PilA
MELLKRFVKEEEGQGLVEYALIIGLISIVAIAALTAAGGSIGDMFSAVSESLGGASDKVKANTESE